jgi:hypothetical protein
MFDNQNEMRHCSKINRTKTCDPVLKHMVKKVRIWSLKFKLIPQINPIQQWFPTDLPKRKGARVAASYHILYQWDWFVGLFLHLGVPPNTEITKWGRCKIK